MIQWITHRNLKQEIEVDITDKSRGTYEASNQIKFKTSMTRSNLSDYSDAYIVVSGIITITAEGADNTTKWLDESNKGVIF